MMNKSGRALSRLRPPAPPRGGVPAGALAACNAAGSSSSASSGEAIYTPGTYTGTATGIGEVKVTMTFSETAITNVEVDTSAETADIGGVAGPTLQEALMAAQNAEIDNISGATITTNAVKKAAASCIEQAMGVHTAGGDAAASSDEDWLGTEPEIDESKVTKTVDVDVAVVGCGIAGVAHGDADPGIFQHRHIAVKRDAVQRVQVRQGHPGGGRGEKNVLAGFLHFLRVLRDDSGAFRVGGAAAVPRPRRE